MAGAQDTIYLCNFRVSVDGEWLCLKELQDVEFSLPEHFPEPSTPSPIEPSPPIMLGSRFQNKALLTFNSFIQLGLFNKAQYVLNVENLCTLPQKLMFNLTRLLIVSCRLLFQLIDPCCIAVLLPYLLSCYYVFRNNHLTHSSHLVPNLAKGNVKTEFYHYGIQCRKL